MAETIVIAGTDTDVGKTVFAAMLTLALDGRYWKPVQSGLEDGGDAQAVRRMTGLPESRFLPEAYRLSRPLSPHQASALDGVTIDVDALTPPEAGERPLIVELAGGLLVPLTATSLQADVVAGWGQPVVLCARTRLGTINHSLLSIEAIKRRNIPLLGVVFLGDPNPESERTIEAFGKTRRLGRLPMLEKLDRESLSLAFERRFNRRDFLTGVAA